MSRAQHLASDGTAAPVEVGQRSEYEVVWRSEAEVTGGQKLIDISVKAKLGVTRVPANAGGVVYRAELREIGVDVVGDDVKAEPIVTRLKAEQGKEFFLKPDAQGRIQAILLREEKGASTSVRRAVAASLQPLTRPELVSDSWRQDEQDVNGTLIAQYRRVAADQIEKKIVAYRTLGTENEARTEAMKPSASGGTKLRYGEEGELDSVTRDEVLDFNMLDTRFTNRARVEITRSSSARVEVQTASLAGLVRMPLFMQDERIEQGAPAVASVTKTMEEQWQALAATDPNVQWDTFGELTKEFAREPSTMDEYVQRMLPGDAEGQTSQLALAAIAQAKSPESQRRLMELAQRAESDMVRGDALMHAALVEEPTADTLQDLRAIAEGGHEDPETRSTSLLALGSAAGNALRASDPQAMALGGEVIHDLVAEFQATEDATERDLVLRALGNSGAPQAFDALRDEMDSSRPEARPAAVDAMRLIEDPRVDQVITQALSDADPQVRRGALQSARYREYTPALEQSLLGLLETESDSESRSIAVSLLGPRIHESDDVAAMLQALAETDPSPAVRDHAQQLLAGAAPVKASE